MNEMSDRIEKAVVLPGNATAGKSYNLGEVLTFAHQDCVLPFLAEKNPLCLKQHTFMKQNKRV